MTRPNIKGCIVASLSAAANLRPAGQLDGSDNLFATVAADRAFSILRSGTATEDAPAAVAELGR